MSLDAAQSVAQFFGKPSQDLSHPDLEEHLEDDREDEGEEMMSVRDLERALSMIRQRRRRLNFVHDSAGSEPVPAARSLLTGG